MDSLEQSAAGDRNKNDVATSWVSTSRFLFYCQIAISAALFIGMCYGLFVNRYKGKPNVEVPTNTQWNPTYK